MREVKPAWIAAAVFVLVAILWLAFKTADTVAPEPVALWVAIQPEGAENATIGRVEMAAGTKFSLHAVVEAETFGGERIYYTEARALVLDGEVVTGESIRPWQRRLETRVLWFTVDGSPPFRQVAAGADLDVPRFQETFRAEWGQAWSVSGDVRPAVENFLPDEESIRREPRFGVQRFHLRMELFAHKGDLVPQLRLQSWGAEELPARVDEFPTVVATLAGPLGPPSKAFGLAQVESAGDPSEVVTDWTRDLLAFSRVTLLAEWLGAQGVTWQDLEWSEVELGVSDVAAQPGDLLRVGTRVVWVLEDRGLPGKLDYDDLCLDFDRGARVERLRSVFVGEGLVDWARASNSTGAATALKEIS